jgi:hypothetical protein
MKVVAIALSLAALASGAATSAGAVGCISGAVVGGVGAHYALHGKHTVAGAVVGCAAGHHMAVMAKRKKAEQKREAMMAHGH